MYHGSSPSQIINAYSWLPISNWKNEGNMCGILPEVFFNTNSCNVSQQCNFNIAFIIICETMFSLWSHLKYHRKILAVGRGGACPSIRPMKRVCRCDDRSIPVTVHPLNLFLLFSVECLSLLESDSRWRHQIETFSALRALCAGNSPVIGEFNAQRPVTRSFDFFFDLCLE